MNMYWSVYENLESEVLSLAYSIMFDDSQLKVHSLKIGDLIVRCAVEIESISKKLYIQEGGEFPVFDKAGKERDLYFDTDCLALLVEKWKIDKKKLIVSSSKMNFSSKKSLLTPLHKSHKRGKSGNQWKRAYQAIKHDRELSFKQANIENILNALGALYILNLYYKNESFWCNPPLLDKSPYANQSKIFAPDICDIAKQHCVLLDSDNIGNVSTDWLMSLQEFMDSSIYVKRYTVDSIYQQRKWYVLFLLNSRTDGTTEKIFQLQRNYSTKEIIDKWNNGEHLDFGQSILKTHDMFEKMESVNYADRNQTVEIVLNKNLPIYPEQTWKEFWETPDGRKILKDFS